MLGFQETVAFNMLLVTFPTANARIQKQLCKGEEFSSNNSVTIDKMKVVRYLVNHSEDSASLTSW